MRYTCAQDISIFELSTLTHKQLKNLACQLADAQRQFISSCPPEHLETHVSRQFEFGIQIKASGRATIASLLARLVERSFWSKRLIQIANHARETISVRSLVIGPSQPYCSDESLRFYLDKQFSRFSSSLKRLQQDLEKPASNTYLISKALCEQAFEAGFVSAFITLVLDDSYRSSNKKYTGKTFDDGYRVLSKIQSSLLEKLGQKGKRGADFYGVRCVEVHIDGCPHFHISLYLKPELSHLINPILNELYSKQSEDMSRKFSDSSSDMVKLVSATDFSSYSASVSYIFKNSYSARSGSKSDLFNGIRQKITISSYGKHQYELIGVNGMVSITREVQKYKSVDEVSRLLGKRIRGQDARSRRYSLVKGMISGDAKKFTRIKSKYFNRYGELSNRTVDVSFESSSKIVPNHQASKLSLRVTCNYYDVDCFNFSPSYLILQWRVSRPLGRPPP